MPGRAVDDRPQIRLDQDRAVVSYIALFIHIWQLFLCVVRSCIFLASMAAGTHLRPIPPRLPGPCTVRSSSGSEAWFAHAQSRENGGGRACARAPFFDAGGRGDVIGGAKFK